MPTVLIVDDDPSHLKIYSWIVERGGYRTVPVLAWAQPLAIPETESIDLALVDYRLGESVSAPVVAKQVRSAFPAAPILVLSDMMYMPEDMAPHATAFVRKGNPEQLLQTLDSYLKPGSAVASDAKEPAA
ncbi:MAG: response regulator [Candidatus Korobacteraceae bacterium]